MTGRSKTSRKTLFVTLALGLALSDAMAAPKKDTPPGRTWKEIQAELRAREGWPEETLRTSTLFLKDSARSPDLLVTSSEACGAGTCVYFLYEPLPSDPELFRAIGTVHGHPERAPTVSNGRHDLIVRSRLGDRADEHSEGKLRFDGNVYR